MPEGQLPARRVGVRELASLIDGWRGDLPNSAGYVALAARLRSLVLDGRLPVHAVLPSERSLAEVIGVSRTTTTAAYRLLRENGFAEGRHGSGTWTTLPASRTVSDAADPPWPVSVDSLEGDLATAAPEAPPELYPAFAAALHDLPRYLPGTGYVTAGLPELRERIAARYTRRGLPTMADQVLVTAGGAQALRLVMSALVRPGDRALIEHPTWPPALQILRECGGKPVALPVDTGWDVATTRHLLRSSGACLAYLMPDGHNPTGLLLAGREREQIVAALSDAHVTAIVDETFAELDLREALAELPEWPGETGRRPGPAPAEPPFGTGRRTVVHIGSASKTFWGGLRVGWVRADRAFVRDLTLAKAAEDLASPVLEQLTVARLLDGAEPLIMRRRREFAARARVLRSALERHLPEWRTTDPQAGLMLWCTLPAPRSTALAHAARQVGLKLTPGPRFGVDGGFESRLRLTFSRDEVELERSIAVLARVWHDAVPAHAEAVDFTVV